MTVSNQGGVQNSQTNIEQQNINLNRIPVVAVQNNNVVKREFIVYNEGQGSGKNNIETQTNNNQRENHNEKIGKQTNHNGHNYHYGREIRRMTVNNQDGVQNSQTNIEQQNINSQPSIPVAALQNNNIANF